MPCFFCIAVITAVAGAITSAVIDAMEDRLAEAGATGVRGVSETASAAVIECTVTAGDVSAPVRITVFKPHRRARIQVLTHDVTREQAESIQDRVAQLLDLRVVDRSNPESEAKVHEAEQLLQSDQEPLGPPTVPPVGRAVPPFER